MMPRAAAIALAVGLAACCAIQSARAEVIVGAGGGLSQLSKYKDVDEGTAYRVFAGYRASDLPLYFEVQYFDSGELDIDDFDGVDNISMQFDGWTAAVGYRAVLSDKGSDIVLKGGGYIQDTELESSLGDAKDDGSGAMVGLTINWMLTDRFGVSFDAQGLFGVEDFANKEDLTLLTIGAVYSFYTD
ncbi:MAG: hypothetical protein K0Q76_3626 [Panacagrimonas sp.]|jgi:hypothetical protein|nr:outer membrane beta-barrel protein [Panacagrimonas sp.]MCC2658518.1 hypothetical protein [Panacagrimonas sp.]